MKKIKSISALLVAVLMCVAFASCGSSVDVSALAESYNALADDFNEMANAANESEVLSEEDIEKLNTYADTIESIKAVVENPDEHTQEQVDSLVTSCKEIQTWVAQTKKAIDAVSAVPDVTELNSAYNALADDFNEMANYINDSDFATEEQIAKLNEYADVIEKVKSVIEKPNGYTQAKIDEMTDNCKGIQEWVNTTMAALKG